MTFNFAAQPASNPPFGQMPSFGAQQPFGAAATLPNATLPQFGTTFGVASPPTGLQFANPATPSLFGQTQAQTQPGTFSLGALTSTAGSTFGTPGLFGTGAAAPNTGLTFGTATSTAPNFGTGLSFGTSAAAPGFGTAALTTTNFGLGSNFNPPALNTGLTFGATAAPLAPTGLNFGAPATTGLSFGTAATPAAGLTFGSTPTSALPGTGLTFGATPTTTVSTFGALTSLGTTPATTALNIGAASPFNVAPTVGLTSSSASVPNLSLGTGTMLNFNSTPASTGLNFAAPPATTAPVPAANLLFNTSSALPSTGLSFGATAGAATTGGLTFGTPSLLTGSTGTSIPTTGLTFNTSFALTQPTTSASTTFGALGLGTTAPATTGSLGLGGFPTSKPTTTTTMPQIGLGGISTGTPNQTTTTSLSQSELSPKSQPLPNELVQIVDQFKAFLKEQKLSSSEIARFSMKELKTVESNIVGVGSMLNEMDGELQKNTCVADKLKMDTAQALQYAEMAQRTFDIPPGMQYDNTAPINFFVQLLQSFELDLQQLRFHLDYISKQVNDGDSPTPLTSGDLALGLRRLHQTFVTLAGRLQAVHSQVEVQKDNYLSLRKVLLKDTTNVFQTQSKELEALEFALNSIANDNKLPDVVAGPSPFNSLGTGQVQLLAQNPPPAYPGTTPIGQATIGINTQGSSAPSFFGPTVANTSLFNSPSNSFQLQKPPTGSKRGKT